MRYRVAYGTRDARGTVRAYDEHSFGKLADAVKRMHGYRRLGLWTWIEDQQGKHVPVPGATRAGVQKGYPVR
jgi:hypothetical protein